MEWEADRLAREEGWGADARAKHVAAKYKEWVAGPGAGVPEEEPMEDEALHAAFKRPGPFLCRRVIDYQQHMVGR